MGLKRPEHFRKFKSNSLLLLFSDQFKDIWVTFSHGHNKKVKYINISSLIKELEPLLLKPWNFNIHKLLWNDLVFWSFVHNSCLLVDKKKYDKHTKPFNFNNFPKYSLKTSICKTFEEKCYCTFDIFQMKIFVFIK